MKEYWFKKYGKRGQIPSHWKGWALFSFIIGIGVQVNSYSNNIVYVSLGTGLICLGGYYLMRQKTHPSEVYSQETDSIGNDIWGSLVGLVGALAVAGIVFLIQHIVS